MIPAVSTPTAASTISRGIVEFAGRFGSSGTLSHVVQKSGQTNRHTSITDRTPLCHVTGGDNVERTDETRRARTATGAMRTNGGLIGEVHFGQARRYLLPFWPKTPSQEAQFPIVAWLL